MEKVLDQLMPQVGGDIGASQEKLGPADGSNWPYQAAVRRPASQCHGMDCMKLGDSKRTLARSCLRVLQEVAVLAIGVSTRRMARFRCSYVVPRGRLFPSACFPALSVCPDCVLALAWSSVTFTHYCHRFVSGRAGTRVRQESEPRNDNE